MTISELSEQNFYAKLDKAHNPPDASVTQTAFDDEYYALYRKVKAIMSEYGTNDPYGQGDYTLEPCIARSRGLGMQITNATIVTPALLQTFQDIVSRYAPEWEIYLGSSEYDFGIFIGPDAVSMHRNNPDLLPQLSEFAAAVS